MKPAKSQLNTIVFLLVTTGVIAVDRFTKIFFSSILDYGQSIPVFKNIFHFTMVHNTGIAFGLFRNADIIFPLMPIIAIILLLFNIYYYRQNNEILSTAYVIGFSLILGGAVGNLVDRIIYGYVIDFIDFRVWPVFNIADSTITVGAVLIGWKCFYLSSHQQR